MTGHMPMFTQKLSNIFYFFNLDWISDMCNFGVSIGFLPLVRIVWIKQCLFWRFEEKIHAHLMKLFHKMYNFQISKIFFVHACQCCWVSQWQPIFKIVRWMWQKLLDKMSLQVSNHINRIFWHHSCIGHHELHRNDRSHAYVYSKIKWDIPLFRFRPKFHTCVVLVWA